MIIIGDNRVTLPTIERGSVQCIATSPPYFGLRLYGDAGEEIGKESALDAYVASLVGVMRLCREALRDDGVAWVNLGDSYGKDGSALLVPFRVATALQQDGWILRAMLPWIKVSSMPESVQSRPSIAHEYVLFLTKRPSGYFYDADAVRVAQNAATLDRYRYGFNKVGKGIQSNGASHTKANGADGGAIDSNPAGRSLRSSDFWRAGARSAAEALQQAADGEAIGLVTNDDAPAAFVVNPKGSGIPHFAMWPTRLVAPMIMAGTPEAGCCVECGAPWVRVVERERLRSAPPSGNRETGRWAEQRDVGQVGGRMLRTPLGFRPSCSHHAPSRPAIVLDPFVGAGTTIGVAEALGRQAIGCELYEKNAALLPQRTEIVRAEVAEYLRERAQGDKAAAIEADARGQVALFAGGS